MDKYRRVVEVYSKLPPVFGDDQQIHDTLEACDITPEELPDLAKYLAGEFQKVHLEGPFELEEKIEQLQYGVNIIFEAKTFGYFVYFESRYIPRVSIQ